MKKILGIATLAVLLAGTSFAQNLVTNGGFELGSTTNVIGTGGMIGWNQYNSTDAIYNSAGADTFLDDGTYDPSGAVPGTHSGSYMADFGAWQHDPITGAGIPTGIYQSIATTAGHNYNVSFWLANDDGCSLPGAPDNCLSSITVTFGGTTLISNTLEDAYGWKFFSFAVTATASSSDLIFNIEQDPAYYHLDDVSVEETPEPASLTLLGTALSLGAGFIRKFRS